MEHSVYIELQPDVTVHRISLPHVIDKHQTKHLFIALQSALLYLKKTPPDIGKLWLKELSGFRADLAQDKILDTVKIEDNLVQKERKILDFLKLSHHSIHHLTFKLLNSENQPIVLEKPSYLTLRLKTMEPEGESFNIHVTEEGKRKISSFKYQLPYPVHLSETGTWKLALSSIIFPNPNIGNDSALRVAVAYGNLAKSWSYDEEKVKNIRKFIYHLQENVKTKLELPAESSFLVGILQDKRIAFLSDLEISITFSNRLGYLLGFVGEGYTKAGKEFKLEKNVKYSSPYPVNMGRDVTDVAYVRCSQIAPSIVNSSFDHILKVIPVSSKRDKYFYYETEQLEFHNLLPTTLSHINIELLDQYSLPLPYKSTRFDKIMLSLKVKHEQ